MYALHTYEVRLFFSFLFFPFVTFFIGNIYIQAFPNFSSFLFFILFLFFLFYTCSQNIQATLL
ncbi:hypothetical protein P167DRAFT_227849 [Morchella conica CCBAS932]|uniref:Uncharacterized protein n=1 Tax=Morchella conica CCBAS932 TaxID=1392247 RepID=A0A3N4KKX9_9PEZI|nr:hypothetical protein P167DRAFT_227849 [Morchella conica CCBAS932]